MSSPDNSEREIFNAALDIADAAERAAFVEQACGGDADLFHRVEILLQAHESVGSFLGPEEGDTDFAPVPEGPGTRVGRYKLLERIGEGGFGIVYLAEQEEPVRRRVALKIIKLGMDTRTVVARFEAERQALAMMDHPNIAKVLDGGTTESGRPYFVMEVVRGVPLTTFCDKNRLTMRERLELFLPVCHAVQHAHQKGVIHRDLKPSNILVSRHDDKPVPIVIDFGVAKAMQQNLTEKTLFTRFHQIIGTPTYMSPEQVGASDLDVDTRSDIYSLGVVLYELLAGRPPFDPSSLLAAGYAEIERVIREIEPPVPSRRLATLTDAEQQTAAECRRTDTVRLAGHLRGDLDRIVMKCVEKDRTRRYDTASDLALDLGRHLRDEPVLARPDSAGYRLRKFVRRHRKSVVFAAILWITLLAGFVGTLVQARRANAERRHASEQRDFALRQLSRAEAINELNAFLLRDAAPSGKPFTARELLSRAEQIIDRDGIDSPENRVEMLVAVGGQYTTLDEPERARPLLRKAYDLSRNLRDHLVRARAGAAYADVIARAGEFEEAERLLQDAFAEIGDSSRYDLERVSCLLIGGNIARESGDVLRAVARVESAQKILQTSGQESKLLELTVLMDLAESYRMAGRLGDAMSAFEQADKRMTALGRGDTDKAGTLLNNWALVLHRLGRDRDAERLYRRAIAISKTDDTERGVSPMLLNNLGFSLLELHRLDEAADYAERADAAARKAGDQLIVNLALNLRVSIYREQGDLDRAERVLAELEPRWTSMMPENYIGRAVLAEHHAELALARGEVDTALRQADRAITLAEGSPQGADLRRAYLYDRSKVELRLGKLDAAVKDIELALAAEKAIAGPTMLTSRVGRCYLIRGRILAAQGQADAAHRDFELARQNLLDALGPEHPDTREAESLLSDESTTH